MPFFITNDNCKIYYEEKGQGQPLIMVHGWSCNRHYFEKQVEAFKKDFRVITFDLRGHGDSDRPETNNTITQLASDLDQLINYLDLDQVNLLGWSMGVHVSWEYIKNFGTKKLNKLVCLDMSAKIMNNPGEDWPHSLTQNFGTKECVELLDGLVTNFMATAEDQAKLMLAGGPRMDLIPWILDNKRKNSPHTLINFWISMCRKDYRELVKTIDIPTLITYGKGPSLYHEENSLWLRDNIPGAKLHGFEGGHIHHLQDESFNDVVLDFLRN